MNDDDTLDEPEELLEQARQAASKQDTPDDDTPPAGPPPRQDGDEIIPADKGAPPPGGDETIPSRADPHPVEDDETIDVAPDLIRKLREERASQQSEPPDLASPRNLASPQPPIRKTSTKRRTITALFTLLVSTAAALLILWSLGAFSGDNEPVGPGIDQSEGEGEAGEEGEGEAGEEGEGEAGEEGEGEAGEEGEGEAGEEGEGEAGEEGEGEAGEEGEGEAGEEGEGEAGEEGGCPEGYEEPSDGCVMECPDGTHIPLGVSCPPGRPILNVEAEGRTITVVWEPSEVGTPVTSWELDTGAGPHPLPLETTSKTYSGERIGEHYFAVRACYEGRCGEYATESVTVGCPEGYEPVFDGCVMECPDGTHIPLGVSCPPGRPILNVEAEGRTITVVWEPSEVGTPVTSWELDTGAGPHPLPLETTSKTYSGERIGEHYFAVRACYEGRCGEYATESVTVAVRPSRPNLTVHDRTGRIQMSWTANDNGSPITRWEVNDGALPGAPSSSATSHTWNNVEPGRYTITVRACNAAGCGLTASERVTVAVRPSRPNLTVHDRTGRIQMSWTANDNGSPITRWEVEVNDDALPGVPSSSATSHTWNNVEPGRYAITVRACNAAGCGPSSTWIVNVQA